MTWANGIVAKYPRQGIKKRRGFSATGTSVDIDTEAQLGRQRNAWLPYPTALS